MSGWKGSARRARLPADWGKRRAAQLEADGHRCTAIDYGTRCPVTTGLEVDHVEAMKDDHSRLTTLCKKHHAEKSAREGVKARAAKTARTHNKFRRTPEAHPSSW